MAIGSPDLVFARCRDLAQELVNRDLHFVVEGVVLSYHQAMVVPHSPFLLTLLGRVNEKEQTVYLEGVTSSAVMALMEFIYTGATIVTAKFASEVQQVQSILQFQVVVQSLVLAPPGQHPRGIPTRIPENSTPRDERKRQMEGRSGEKPPKRRYTRRKYAAEVKIKKERVESPEHGAGKENAVPEYCVKRTGSQIDQNCETVDEADIALPREGTKEYRAEYKKVRDRLWKRRIREGHAKPYITKEEVEKEMRNPKSPKSDASDSEARAPQSSNFDAETSSAIEGTISPAAVPAKYKSVFPTRLGASLIPEHQQPTSPQPSLPPLPLMLPLENFKSELLSPLTQLTSKLSKSATTTPLESLMPSTRSLPFASLAPGLPFSHPDIGHQSDPQDLPNRINQWIEFPQLMDANLEYINPSTANSPTIEATGELEDTFNNEGNGNINSNKENSKLGVPGSHKEDFTNNFNSNMEDCTNLTDLWTRLPYTEEDFPFQV